MYEAFILSIERWKVKWKSENMETKKTIWCAYDSVWIAGGICGQEGSADHRAFGRGFAFRTAKEDTRAGEDPALFYDLKKTDYEEMTIQTPEIEEGDAEPFVQNYIVWMEQVGEREQYQGTGSETVEAVQPLYSVEIDGGMIVAWRRH